MEVEAINAYDVIMFASATVGEARAIEIILPIFGCAIWGAY